ncbi:MAG: hypothetical protein WA962_11240, partial [Ornithinimicrobium sp.]
MLFNRAAVSGVGRPVDADGFPQGPWTPDLLAEAISQIDANRVGIELRTVQLWFQKNDKGVSTDNIRWLARIFGCDDPDATSAWQAELSAAQARLVAQRKEARTRSDPELPEPPGQVDLPNVASQAKPARSPAGGTGITGVTDRSNLAAKSEAIFLNQHPMTLPAVVWAGCTALGFLSYIVGVESVTYSPIDGLDKQVGFLWAPSWTILPMVILPLFLGFVVALLIYWKNDARPELISDISSPDEGAKDWKSKIASFNYLFWIIFVVSFGFVFVLQWSGVHLQSLLQGDSSGYMIDWSIVAIVRPDVAGIRESITLSFVAYLYYGFLMWLLFSGLALLFIIANDYYEVCSQPSRHLSDKAEYEIYRTGQKIISDVYRCSILTILFATCLKLQSTYLLSSGENIVSWLMNDAALFFGQRSIEAFALELRGIPQFTSVLLITVTSAIFGLCLLQINSVLRPSIDAADERNSVMKGQ